uniref:NADH-ubiquinone oxidoreductase chain 5 n=1 Tax=Seladonia aeraria TaxID=1310367 RepID=A0A7T9KR75_9HYME|nr:NADH dehydrogenase subunit 5 [Seladonia aeraria]QQS74775.1 NADH dehydrogenase subunit 5 [Seladonia aeraria]
MYGLIIYGMNLFLMGMFFMLMGMYMYMYKMMLIMEWTILVLSGMKFNYMIYLDYMGLMYMSVVLIISFFIMLYSMDYMEGDMYISRFKYLLLLFIFSMCLMILSPSILSILLGWDGLGLISYCLVIYYQNKNAYNSGMLTILCNRLGDVGLLMLISMNSFLGSWNLMLYSMSLMMMIFMLIAMITKSAQLPFSAWLPAAMTAPTPISSLVHSSTLVTAGVYLLIRYNKFILVEVKSYIIIISSLTMFMAGLMANYEYNLKKIIALSTLSQLGFMMSILGMGLVSLGFYHLLIHAFFKSLMFMCVGGYIHTSLGNQDLRKFKGVLNMTPLKSIVFIFSFFNLSGFPFFSGFYSKDLILEFMMVSDINKLMIYILMISTILTVNYTIRVIKLFFNFNMMVFSYQYMGDGKFMIFCKFIMMLLVIFLGYVYLNLVNYYICMMTIMDKVSLMMLYMLSWVISSSFFYSQKSKMNFKYLEFIMSMFYSIFFFKVIYLNFLKFMLMYDKFNEKWLDKMLGVNFKKMFYLQKLYPYMNNWVYSIHMMKLMKLYSILLMYFLFMYN